MITGENHIISIDKLTTDDTFWHLISHLLCVLQLYHTYYLQKRDVLSERSNSSKEWNYKNQSSNSN